MDNFRIKTIKKCIEWLAVVALILGSFNDFGLKAFANLEQEENFCMDKMNNLPIDEDFLTEATKLPNVDELDESRIEPIVHMNDTVEQVVLNEKSCYDKIFQEVEKLKQTAKNSQSYLKKEDACLPEKMRLANEIYRWVATNIRADHESFESVKNDEQVYVKPQDEYFVYDQRLGFCEGYARLVNLMMRMADIPCIYVASINGPAENYGHAFNAVYIEDTCADRKGWTLLDAANAWPGGFDRYKSLTKFLFGEAFFNLDFFNIIMPKNDDYVKNIYYLLEISCEQCHNPSSEFIEEKNKKIENVLKILNSDEKYENCSHFKEIKFFNHSGYLYFNYKTDVTMIKAKEIRNEEEEGFLKNDFSCFETKLREYNENFMLNSDIIYNLLLLTGLEKLDLNQENMAELKNIKFGFEESLRDGHEFLYAYCGKKPNAVANNINETDQKNQNSYYFKEKFEEFFPAFYNSKQSFKDANMRIIKKSFHKISTFEIDIGNINTPILLGESHEGNARLDLNCQVDMDISCFSSLSPDEQKKQIDEIKQTLKMLNVFDDRIECGGLFQINNKYGITVNIPGCIEKLKLHGNISIDIGASDELIEIDTTDSEIYDFEDGILYEKFDGKRGKEIARTKKNPVKI